jgi:vacuolar-type H+-ATPase subunit E/Vma4
MRTDAGPLLEQIRATAQAKSAAQVAGAVAEAERIRGEARARAARLRAAALAAHERQAAAALARTEAETSQRVGHATLTARAEALDRVFVAAGRRFEALATHAALGDLLTRAIGEAVTYVPDGAVTVRCTPGIAATVKRALASLGREGDTIIPDEHTPIGVIVESGDGRVAVDATFARRLQRDRPRLSTVLARHLAEGTR